jgi:hypothetical protein
MIAAVLTLVTTAYVWEPHWPEHPGSTPEAALRQAMTPVVGCFFAEKREPSSRAARMAGLPTTFPDIPAYWYRRMYGFWSAGEGGSVEPLRPMLPASQRLIADALAATDGLPGRSANLSVANREAAPACQGAPTEISRFPSGSGWTFAETRIRCGFACGENRLWALQRHGSRWTIRAFMRLP